MKRNDIQRRLWDSLTSYWRWNRENLARNLSAFAGNGKHVIGTDGHVEGGSERDMGGGNSSMSSFFSSVPPSSSSSSSSLPLDAMKRVVHERRSCKRFDPTKPIDLDVVSELLAMTIRAPTSLNLQPWVAVVIHEEEQRETLSRAALGQPQPRDAPVTVVFAGDMEPEINAPAVLEMGLESGYYHSLYGAPYLRHAYYLLHGGPCEVMSHVKAIVSAWYSESTGNAMLSVPRNKQAYAWKQVMIPATTFLYLATAAGFDTAILEGFDEAQVRRVAGLPPRFTVPVIISVGYGAKNGFHSVRSPRFPTKHLVRWGKF
ncbi:nitroreductase [Trypanosoma cruzi marinkellei]|uniref:Nitroreductase n=1 Tax=Trypanosoma cruzi marinkellei TaxID=85056 RepID=K2NMK8_TRYCR|nr:nitroreductase [Trypanosoma cruzi marinkellei]